MCPYPSLTGTNKLLLNLPNKCLFGTMISFHLIFASFHPGTYHCIFRYKNSYSVATKDITVHPLPLEPYIMVDPLEAAISCKGSHYFKCCIEEDEHYKVTFQVDSISFPAGKTPTAELLVHSIHYMWSLKI